MLTFISGATQGILITPRFNDVVIYTPDE